MIDATVSFDHIAADAVEWLNDVGEPDAVLTASANRFAQGTDYANETTIIDWLKSVGVTRINGIHSDGDSPVWMVLSQQDHLLDMDLILAYVEVEFEPDGDDIPRQERLLLWTGIDYHMYRMRDVEVYTVREDAESAFSYASGWVGHVARGECPMEWTVETSGTLFNQTTQRATDVRILTDDDSTLHCPACGEELGVMVG
jgi:hypothetical protein